MSNTNKVEYLAEYLSNIFNDYENCKVSVENVLKWINQFNKVDATEKDRVTILEELVRIFKKTYFSKEKLVKAFNYIITNEKKISFLNIQEFRKSDKYKSSSQSDYIRLMQENGFNIEINNYDADILIYFDDYIISGNSIRQDLKFLLNKQILSKTHFWFLAVTTNGLYRLQRDNNYKNLIIKYFFNFENRLSFKNKSDVLWPYETEIDICKYFNYKNMKFREGFKKSNLFEDDEKRKLIENYFWKAGCYILNKTRGSALLPLGAGYPETVGSGIISATYRNIPNNAPICLWWGDESENNYWFPLLKRKTNKTQYLNKIQKDIKGYL